MSDTDLVDSTSLKLPLTSTSRPTSGSCTNTTSPRLSCAKSVMPIRTLPPSTLAHSWSEEYRRSSGMFMRREPIRSPRSGSSLHLQHAPAVLLGQCPGLVRGVGLRPHVGDRLLGIGEQQDPALVVMDLHAVDQLDLAPLAL